MKWHATLLCCLKKKNYYKFFKLLYFLIASHFELMTIFFLFSEAISWISPAVQPHVSLHAFSRILWEWLILIHDSWWSWQCRHCNSFHICHVQTTSVHIFTPEFACCWRYHRPTIWVSHNVFYLTTAYLCLFYWFLSKHKSVSLFYSLSKYWYVLAVDFQESK